MKLFNTLLGIMFASCAVTQAQSVPIPHIDRSGAHPALIVDGKPFLMLGAQMNNSSAWPATMPAVWETMEKLGVNTVEAPVYWETLEPSEGHFDFAQIDMLLAQARLHKKRLVLLWFGTWKNGSPGYVPGWMKRDERRFPLARKQDGTALYSFSPFGADTLAADSRAFKALMLHLKASDPQRTVLMVQVENEAGLWGAMRDHSAAAEAQFAKPVPGDVLDAMGKSSVQGNWGQVFGADADEYFYAWAIASYIEQVAKAGRAAYPLPLYTNAALRDPIHPGGPLSFESGGPTFDVLPLWHAIAPSLEGFGPDIYMPEHEKYMAVLRQYSVPWNAFFVPETGNSAVYAHYFFAALGAGAFGWSPFGMDATGYSNYPLGAARIDDEAIKPFVNNYKAVASMNGQLAGWMQQGRVRGVAEAPETHREEIQFVGVAPWKATVSYGMPSFYTEKPAPGNRQLEGQALIVALDSNEFLVTGMHCRVDFSLLGKQRMWISVEEGSYEHGMWKTARLWNGDQTDYGLNFGEMGQLLRVRLAAY